MVRRNTFTYCTGILLLYLKEDHAHVVLYLPAMRPFYYPIVTALKANYLPGWDLLLCCRVCTKDRCHGNQTHRH